MPNDKDCHADLEGVDDDRLAADELKDFVDGRVGTSGFGSTSDLIRRDRERHQLRSLLLDGAASDAGPVADEHYFASLRSRTTPTA